MNTSLLYIFEIYVLSRSISTLNIGQNTRTANLLLKHLSAVWAERKNRSKPTRLWFVSCQGYRSSLAPSTSKPSELSRKTWNHLQTEIKIEKQKFVTRIMIDNEKLFEWAAKLPATDDPSDLIALLETHDLFPGSVFWTAIKYVHFSRTVFYFSFKFGGMWSRMEERRDRN